MPMQKRFRLIVIPLILLLAAAGVAWMNFRSDQSDYRTLKIASFLEENPTLPQGGTVFLGDSLTDLCDLEATYPGMGYINRGIGGDTTEGVLERFDETVLPLEPITIVLLIGINDLNYGRSVDATIQSYERLIDHIHSNLPDVRLILVSLPPVNGTKYAPLLLIQEKIVLLNEALALLAEDNGADFVDIHPALLEQGADRLDPAYSDDGLHWNAAGYAIVAASIQAELDH
jgi:lysophospholipase L1-like esterase